MAKKYYAVAKGKSNKPMVLETWSQCQKEVIGCKGAIYKSFPTKEECEHFIKLHQGSTDYKKEEKETDMLEGIEIYVDGSFAVDKGNFSYGLLVVEDGKIIFEDNGVGYDEEAIPLRNVSGEVLGAMKAVDYAISKGYEKINLCFDYQGIESWALGTWKRNNKITREYHEFMELKKSKINIKFKKIKGHSGNEFNDRADILAKKALGIK